MYIIAQVYVFPLSLTAWAIGPLTVTGEQLIGQGEYH
jgi:hypothetical protein